MSTVKGRAEKAWTGAQHLMKGVPLEERLLRQWNLTQLRTAILLLKNGGNSDVSYAHTSNMPCAK